MQWTKEKSSPLSNNKCLSNKWKNSVFYSLRDFEGDQMQTACSKFFAKFQRAVVFVCSWCSRRRWKNGSETRRNEISFIRIEKSPFSRWRRNSKVNSSSGSNRKNQTREDNKQKTKNTHWYEQKCQSHTCSGTINSSMYDIDLTTTTSPLISSAPYSG